MKCPDNCPRLHHFSAWLAELLAPVMLGAKSAEILSFQKKTSTYYKDLQALEQCRKNCTRLNIERIDCLNGTTKFFVYQADELNGWLSDPRHLNFLINQGYPKIYSLNGYLEVLYERLQQADSFPHEIGIFLGYPLKDIMGFMGLANLKLTSVSKWRVYGDPRISVEKMTKIDEARHKVAALLKTEPAEQVFRLLA